MKFIQGLGGVYVKGSKVISISVPIGMLEKIDEAADRAPQMYTDEQALKIYDFNEEYEDYLKELGD